MRDNLHVTEQELNKQRDYIKRLRGAISGLTYYIETYGCQMNAHDSERLAGMLNDMGCTSASVRDAADIIIFNTCCIRENAQRRALGNVGWTSELKKTRPDVIVCVCGCMTQQSGMASSLSRRFKFVDVVFGTHNAHEFPELLYSAIVDKHKSAHIVETEGRILEDMPYARTSGHSAYVNIAYGCNNFCTYCIVPYVRGRERSRDVGKILREVEGLLNDGYKEIALLGQNVNSYGNDLPGAPKFPALLKALDALNVPRIRFMTSHPKDMSDELIEAMASLKGIAPHFHAPAQSGNDEILRLMNRGYTRAQYLNRITALRAAMPQIGITTDIIVGFPGETEVQFADTLKLMAQARYDSAYTFIFSPRKGTQAAEMPDLTPIAEKKERLSRLIALQEGITQEGYRSLIGSTEHVLVDNISARSDAQVSGRGGRGIMITLPGDSSDIGRFVEISITGAAKNTLRGQRI